MALPYYLREREKEQRIQEIRSKQTADMKEADFNYIEHRAQGRRFLRRLHCERQEAEMEDKIFKAKEAQMMMRSQLEQEEKLAQQLDDMKREEERQIKLRQLLRENCFELRELEAQLKAGYAAKELIAQMAEKEVAKTEEKIQEKKICEALSASWARDHDLELCREKEQRKKKIEYRQELQDQLIASEKKREIAYYEFLEEKRLIDAIASRIIEEDCKVEEERLRKMKKTKEELDVYLKLREEEKRKRKEEMDEENRRYLAFLQEQGNQDDELKRIKEERRMKLEEMKFLLGKKVYEEELRRLEHAEMLEDLWEAEALEVARQQEQDDMESRLRKRLLLRQIQRQEARDRYAMLQAQVEEDRQWKEDLMAKFAADERVDQMTALRRRQMQLDHRKAVETMLEERRAARAAEMQRLVQERELEESEDAARRTIIDEERIRMLREHAEALLGYLPKGVLRETDLPQLGEDFVKRFAGLKTARTHEECDAEEKPPEAPADKQKVSVHSSVLQKLALRRT